MSSLRTPGQLVTPVCERIGCENPLRRTGPARSQQKKYCSNACRAISKSAAARSLAESVALDEVRAQVVPVVREALTDNVLQNLKALVELLPAALDTLQENLNDEDPKIREHAADAILRYTVGHAGIAPQAAEAKAQSINLNFGLPMQGEVAEDHEGSVLGTAEDAPPAVRECVECGETKPVDQFVGQSPRCDVCHDAMLADIRTKFPGMLESGHGAER